MRGSTALLDATASAVIEALGGVTDWGLARAGAHAGQHHSDIVADEAALAVLLPGGVGVLSEESGLHEADRDVVVVVDPLDGSTNAAHGIPWYAMSLCAVDAEGPRAAARHQPRDGRALRGGARRGRDAQRRADRARRVRRGSATSLVGLSGYPPRRFGWKQYRALGASALDLCAVACGRLDAFVDCSRNAHGPWDYLGGMLVCLEAGAVDARRVRRRRSSSSSTTRGARRSPPRLRCSLGEIIAARRSFE